MKKLNLYQRKLHVYEIIIGFLLSSIKYVLGAGYLVLVVENWKLALTVNLLGSFSGVLFFSFLGKYVLRVLYKFKKSKKFTKTNRTIIKFKKAGGLGIIALLTPILLSIPVGCIAGVAIYRNKPKVITYMFISILAWATIFFGLKLILGVNLNNVI